MSIKTITQKIRNPFYNPINNPDSKKWIDLIEIKESGTTPIFKGELEKYNLNSSDLTNLVDGAAIKTGAVGPRAIQEGAVGPEAIQEGAITTDKLNVEASVNITYPYKITIVGSSLEITSNNEYARFDVDIKDKNKEEE